MKTWTMLVLAGVGLAVWSGTNSPIRADEAQLAAGRAQAAEQLVQLQSALDAAARAQTVGTAAAGRAQAAAQVVQLQRALDAARKQSAPTSADQQKQLDELRAEVAVLRAQIEVLRAQQKLDALRSQRSVDLARSQGELDRMRSFYKSITPNRAVRILPPVRAQSDFVIPPRRGLDNMVRPAPDQKRDDMVRPAPNQERSTFIAPPRGLRDGDIFQIRPAPNRASSVDIFGEAGRARIAALRAQIAALRAAAFLTKPSPAQKSQLSALEAQLAAEMRAEQTQKIARALEDARRAQPRTPQPRTPQPRTPQPR